MLTDRHLQGVGMTSQRTRERLIRRLMDQGIGNVEVLNAMRTIPRHLFLDEALAHRAYEDNALPIGYGQTLSQPFIVARMTETLIDNAKRLGKVLEIGTGSGYQTAILASMVDKLYTVERIQPLLEKAHRRLDQLQFFNVSYRLADGHQGWPQTERYDAILSAAASSTLPDEFKRQLAPDGVLVTPVGADRQNLIMIIRVGDTDQFTTEVLEPVCFVPLLKGVIC